MKASNERSPLLQVTTKTVDRKKNKLPGEKLSKKKRTLLISQYYEEQERLKELYLQDRENLLAENRQQYVEGCAKQEEDRTRANKILASIVFVLNLAILCGNLAASILSGSYSVISAFVDSAMDITSSAIIFCALWAVNNTNMFNYPRGRQRLELLAVIICSIIMGVANIMMIIQSVESIVNDMVNPDANIPTIVILWTGIALKIIFMIICYRHGTTSSKILAMDQRNDILTSVVAFFGVFIGDHFWKYADPMGAILVCSFIAVSWFSNAFEQIPLIAGHRGEKEQISRILTIGLSHDERIRYFDHIMVYHIGEKALVELHIVLDETLPLKITHDIAETLEVKIKALDFVERCFVHVDYWCDGREDG